jgi:hypothetical protein
MDRRDRRAYVPAFPLGKGHHLTMRTPVQQREGQVWSGSEEWDSAQVSRAASNEVLGGLDWHGLIHVTRMCPCNRCVAVYKRLPGNLIETTKG